MKHIRYITSNKTVCEKPDGIVSDFIVIDRGPRDEAACEPCYQLVVAHNKRQYEREMMINIPQGHSVSSEPVLPRDFYFGLVIASAFWISVIAAYLVLSKWG